MSNDTNLIMTIQGGEELRRALEKKAAEFIAEMGSTLPAEAQALADAAQSGVPRASGTLANSQVVSTDSKDTHFTAAVAYEDPKAAAVHEGIHGRAHHTGTRGFKWFEKAMNAFEGGFTERIASKLRNLVGGGG